MIVTALVFIVGLIFGTIAGYTLAALMFLSSKESRIREDEQDAEI